MRVGIDQEARRGRSGVCVAVAFVLATSLPIQSAEAQSSASRSVTTPADAASAAEIRQRFLDFNAAWERRDQAFIDAYYAHDSTGVFFFERRQLSGWPRVDTLYQNMFASAARGRVRSLYDILDVGARGDLGWLAANFRLEVIEASGDTTVDEGRQSLVFERRDGQWVVVHRHTSFQAAPGAQRRVPLHLTPGPLWSPLDDTTGGPDARTIRARRESSNAAIARHDTAGIGAILAPHALVVSSTSAVSTGRAAMLARFAEQFAARPDVVYRRTAEDVRVFAPWTMAFERGTWTGSWTDADGRISLRGSYAAKWRRIDGTWLVESETYVPESCTGGAYCRTMRSTDPRDEDGEGQPPARAGTLAATRGMTTPRAAHSMTPLADGTLLLVGGMSQLNRDVGGAERYDPATGRFEAVASTAVGRKSHTATRLGDGRVLVTGGLDERNDYLRSAEFFDPATRTFSPAGEMSVARAGHEAVLLADGRVLLIGGTGTGWSFLASAELYDPRTGRFTPTGTMAEARESHVALRLADGRVLVVGGHRDRRAAMTIYRSAEIYDPATGRFTATGEMGIKRHKHDAILLPDGRVLVIGGADERDGDGAYASTELWDPATGKFTAGAPLRVPRYKLRGTSLLLDSHRVLVAGGAARAELYDVATGTSSIVEGDERMAGLFSTAAPLPDGRVLITGGYGNGTGPRASAWLYTPDGWRARR